MSGRSSGKSIGEDDLQENEVMATSEKKIGLGKKGRKPHQICSQCGAFVGTTAGWIEHTFLAHKDHKETGAVPKSTKVNPFLSNRHDD